MQPMGLRGPYKKVLSYKFSENINLALGPESGPAKFINLARLLFHRVSTAFCFLPQSKNS